MKVQIFTLRYDRNKEQFDDTKLNEFVATGIDVIDVREHFFSCDGTPVWALLVSYRETAYAVSGNSRSMRGVRLGLFQGFV